MDYTLQPWVVAHRGARFEAPENTRSAFDIALTYPIDGIECDVQLTKDNIPVIYHDRTLSKLNDGRKRISDYTLAKLRTKRWRSWSETHYYNEPLLTLEEVLCGYGKRTRLMIEIKSRLWDRIAGRSRLLTVIVLKAIRKFVPESHHKNIFILSFDPSVLILAQKIEPHWRYILNLLESPSTLTNESFHLENLHGLCVPIEKHSNSLEHFVHSHGKVLIVHRCNVLTEVKIALKWNVDIIITDKPGWLTTIFNNQGKAQ